jgi:hypothetical protein
MKAMKSSSSLLSFCVLLALGLIACGKAADAPPSSPGGRAVRFSLPSDAGDLVSVPLPNQAAVIDAWSPTCVPCKEKLPKLVARRKDIEAANAKLVLVAVLADGESTDEAKKALESWGVREPFLVDRGSVLRSEAGVDALPSTIIVGPDGSLRWTAKPTSTEEDIVTAARNSR